eukprot:Awhi_evm1s6632
MTNMQTQTLRTRTDDVYLTQEYPINRRRPRHCTLHLLGKCSWGDKCELPHLEKTDEGMFACNDFMSHALNPYAEKPCEH